MCSFDKTNVVIFGQDPYHQKGVANGLAFAINEGYKIPPSLKNIYNEINNQPINTQKILRKIINSLCNLFTLKYTSACKNKRKNILYFAINLLTEHINYNIPINLNLEYTNQIINKINNLYKDIKFNEISPNTDYLFSGVSQNNIEKTISKIEIMNNFIPNE